MDPHQKHTAQLASERHSFTQSSTSNDNNIRAAASLSDYILELRELRSAKTGRCIPALCAFPARFGIFTDGIATLCDVCECSSVLVEQRVDESQRLLST